MRRLLVLLAVALAAAAPAARADAFKAPLLTAAGGDQRGSLVHATVHRALGHATCESRHADSAGLYPDAASHDGSAVTWHLADPRRPAKVSVSLWRLGTDRAVLGSGEAVPVTLTPVRSGSRTTAWLARTAPVGYGDLHLDVVVTWPKGSCGSDQGRYRYRLLSVPAPA